MKTIYDIQQLLKRFGTIVYIGDRVANLELMEEEVRQLYELQMIETKEFQMAILLLRQETQILLGKRERQ
ncbi:YqgQ family protein [Metabacillus herbersteinensis]|uniref:YqgQ family protein n=1 Tax=Metabacillus herbersteinensis TaxID=283816 RepID=A0ABV6G901_9BACI